MSSVNEQVLQAIQYEVSSWANGRATDHPFYQVPDGASKATPGSVLKVEMDTETSAYLLPPATALTRFMYQSENLTNKPVPASAFILWPYSPKSQADGFAVIAWAHGELESTKNKPPSNHKTLSQHFLAPFQLAAQGYVVVGPDYAGLGVHKHESGLDIVHEHMASPSHANDVIYAVQAAQKAFPMLSQDFVVLGHGRGGGAAWATAQRQVDKPIPGYLGGVAISPVTTILDQPEPLLSILGESLIPGLSATFPDFKPGDVFLEGRRLGFAHVDHLLGGAGIMKPNWSENEHVQRYHAMIANGGKKIAGPLLVVQGVTDVRFSSNATTKAVNTTAEAFPKSQLEYVLLPNVSHVPAIQASQRLWMEWIADRFARREVPHNVQRTKILQLLIPRARPSASYHRELNWHLAPATKHYHAPS
ncbi:hypothetical protein JMJ35_006642 [Cladonia borealis]|uniref:Serine aminopeptidase S33 domain-containing protein n=1 Tax=Cladonia borealis TaxID=184061 RepID=A0AA39QXN2_9LECA|nr:hypothetical protein JMJ35_006642 [Cladonia borealis]